MGIFDTNIPGADPEANISLSLYVTAGIFATFALIAVALRFYARRLGKIPLKADDWLILAALPFVYVTNAINCYGPAHNGEARHINKSTPESLRRFFLATYVFEICYNFGIALAKFSLICFYRRIFSTKSFRMPLMVTGILTMGWLIGTTAAVIFSCNPIQSFWEIQTPGKCINERAYYIGQGATNIMLDVALLILPIYYVMQLKMTKAQKWGICGIFLLGFFVTICSAVRLAALIKIARKKEFDFTYDIVDAAIWSVIEDNLSIVCTCLPAMRPLAMKFIRHAKNSSASRYLSYKLGTSAHRIGDTDKGPSVNGRSLNTIGGGRRNSRYTVPHAHDPYATQITKETRMETWYGTESTESAERKEAAYTVRIEACGRGWASDTEGSSTDQVQVLSPSSMAWSSAGGSAVDFEKRGGVEVVRDEEEWVGYNMSEFDPDAGRGGRGHDGGNDNTDDDDRKVSDEERGSGIDSANSWFRSRRVSFETDEDNASAVTEKPLVREPRIEDDVELAEMKGGNKLNGKR